MSNERDYRFVSESPLGVELDEDECRALANVMTVHSLKNGEVLAAEGQPDSALYLLVAGKLDVTQNVGGEQLHLHTMGEGELAGALGFVDGLDRTATLRALDDASVYSLERGTFELLVETHPRLVYKIMRAVTRSTHTILLGLNKQIEELTNYIMKQHGRY